MPPARTTMTITGLPLCRGSCGEFRGKIKLEEKRAEIFQRLHGCIGPSREQELKKRRRSTLQKE